MIGRIHSIETFGTVDGPGIRYIIFMQGCILKCKYCHNRDTWDPDTGKLTTVPELINDIKKYKTYMKNSGGGVTVSGGEPLLQAKFITELFKELKKLGYNTCLDTSGCLPITDCIKELLDYTDIVLLDIKHIDNEKAIQLTCLPNKNNLAFAKYLSDKNIPVWIRQVLVPEYTDNEEDLKKLKEFIDTLNNVQRIEILPYHDLGKSKWDELGVEYELEDVKVPNEKDIEKAKEILGINN